MKKFLILVLAIPFFLITNQKASISGPFSDEFARCIVNSSTPNEKTSFIEWMIRIFNEHPELKDLVEISDNQKIKLDKNIANIFSNLVTVRCKKEAEKAIEFEGYQSMYGAFGAFGAAASQTVLAHPDVEESSQKYAEYLDLSSLDVPNQ